MRETCEFIWELEERFDLLDTLAGDFPLWPALRTTLAQRLLERRGRAQAPHLASRAFWPDPFRLVDSLFANNPLFFRKHVEHLILEHPRVTGEGTLARDAHAGDLEDEWDASGVSWAALSDPSPTSAEKKRSSSRLSTVFLYQWARLESRARGLALPESYAALARGLDDEARRRYGVEWGAELFAKQRYRALSGRRLGYRRLLEASAPRRIFMVVAYGSHVALTSAAQDLGLPVTEVQHGAFSRYHLGYSYPGRASAVPGVPSQFLAWNERWAARLGRIGPVADVRVREPRFLSARRERHRTTPKERTVLVLSQGALGDAIAREFAKVVLRFVGYRLIYKLHPGEYGRGSQYPHLAKLVAEHGVEVVAEGDLEDEMARAELVVGVYSTAIYEALDLGCRALLLDLPGVETMQDLLDSGEAQMV